MTGIFNTQQETDITCLADGVVFSTDPELTGLNGNEVIVGGTGCGKTMSIAEPRILHSEKKSLVVVLTKRKLYENYKEHLENNGYAVDCIDFTRPELSTIGYDPLQHIECEDEVNALASSISRFGCGKPEAEKDPYWRMSGMNVIKCLMMLEIENAKAAGTKPSTQNVIRLMDNIKWNTGRQGPIVETTLDACFDEMEKRNPGNAASSEWYGLISGNSDVTGGCIRSTASNMLNEIRYENILRVMSMEEQVDFRSFDKVKRALFIITSPTKTYYANFLNLLYSQMFDEFVSVAEKKDSMKLDIPVHIIADDFACGCPINNFAGMISIFRAMGISVTMLIQSESQLAGIYGQENAETIINNCDTYVYMGGNDTKTVERIARKANKPEIAISTMKNGGVYVFRRGEKPVFAERYKTAEDPLYMALNSGAVKLRGCI